MRGANEEFFRGKALDLLVARLCYKLINNRGDRSAAGKYSSTVLGGGCRTRAISDQLMSA